MLLGLNFGFNFSEVLPLCMSKSNPLANILEVIDEALANLLQDVREN
jgi:hypothetical protein